MPHAHHRLLSHCRLFHSRLLVINQDFQGMTAFPKPASADNRPYLWNSSFRAGRKTFASKNEWKLPDKKTKQSKTLKPSPSKFPFSQETRRLFALAGCWACGNENCRADCLHHIFGMVSDSPYNAAPMKNNDCHINEKVEEGGKTKVAMGGHGRHLAKEQQQEYLRKTILWLRGCGYEPDDKDKEFLHRYASEENLELALSPEPEMFIAGDLILR